jgi:molybdopterin-dependent oxidoreductase alpha subunit
MKKVLHTLAMVGHIGINKASKALLSKNTCKACGLGMGGQLGGMTNELNEFPSVCNKSIQAQSTDLQAPIPVEIFEHSLEDLQALSEKEFASLGRLNTPLIKLEGENRFKPSSWSIAIQMAANCLSETEADRSYFYASGRSSNEAGFILQLMAREYGTNNVNNCSFYCHQATSVGLANTIGGGTATVGLDDLGHADLIFVIGANPASNHPRLLHQLKNCRDQGGDVIFINPAKEPGLIRFAVPKSPESLIAGGTWIASEYLQPKIGTDDLLLKGIAKAVLESNGAATDYIDQYCDGFLNYQKDIEGLSWQEITATTAVSQTDIEKIANYYCDSKNTIFAWGMGLTHQINGVENVEQVSNLALLRGMVGKRYSGLLPLRGHSNVQGVGSIGVKPTLDEAVIKAMEKYWQISLPRTKGYDTMAAMQAAEQGCIDTALIMGGNLYASNPDARRAEKSLNNINNKIFLTTTLNRGHVVGVDQGLSIILPVAARDEEWQSTTQESMFSFVRLSDGGINRLDNVKPESWILCELAKLILPESPTDYEALSSHQRIRRAIAEIIPELAAITELDNGGKEFHIKDRIMHQPVFKTATKKASFITTKAPALATSGTYPFVMTTVRSEGQFNSIVYEEEDLYRSVNNRWSVLMNSSDIAALGLVAGDLVSLSSAQGQMKQVEVFDFDIPVGNCLTYYPEANVLTSQAVDPRSKTPSFKATAIKISTET